MRPYLAFLALVFLAGALWLFLRRWSVAARGVPVAGRVVDFESREDEDSVHYLPVVSFTDQQGRSHRFTATAGGAERRPPVGSSVTVRYLPADPGQAHIASFLHLWGAPLGLLALGACALLAAVQE